MASLTRLVKKLRYVPESSALWGRTIAGQTHIQNRSRRLMIAVRGKKEKKQAKGQKAV